MFHFRSTLTPSTVHLPNQELPITVAQPLFISSNHTDYF